MARPLRIDLADSFYHVLNRGVERRFIFDDDADWHPSSSPNYELVTLAAPTDSNMGDNQFQVSWTVAVSGKEKTVTVTVAPQVQNELTSKSLSVATVFSR